VESYKKITDNYNDSLLKIPKVGKGQASNTAGEMRWYSMIYALSGGNFLNRTEVLLQPIDESFAWLIYENRRAYDEAIHYKNLQ